jgi:hypothetical protein
VKHIEKSSGKHHTGKAILSLDYWVVHSREQSYVLSGAMEIENASHKHYNRMALVIF